MKLQTVIQLSGAVLSAVLALGAPTPASATTKNYVFSPGRTFTVNTALGIATQIVIEPGEKVLDFGTGFSAGWDIVRRDNIFYIKPKDPDAETNMYIRTDRRLYLLDLRIVSRDWRTLSDAKSAGVNYIVQFNSNSDFVADDVKRLLPQAQDGRRAAERASGEAAPVRLDIEPTAFSPEPTGRGAYHTNYSVATSDNAEWLVPRRVYDDGKFTYIHFAEKTPTAAIFGRSGLRAQEYVVNKTVPREDLQVVHGVHPVLVVRYGEHTVAIRRQVSSQLPAPAAGGPGVPTALPAVATLSPAVATPAPTAAIPALAAAPAASAASSSGAVARPAAPVIQQASAEPAKPAAPGPTVSAKPVLAQAPVVPAAPAAAASIATWEVRIDDIAISRTLKRWGLQAGYQVVWSSPKDFPVAATASITGDFHEALKSVIESLAQTDSPVMAVYYVNNVVQIVRFTGQAADLKGKN
jgi:type IV secretion system protein VirB9